MAGPAPYQCSAWWEGWRLGFVNYIEFRMDNKAVSLSHRAAAMPLPCLGTTTAIVCSFFVNIHWHWHGVRTVGQASIHGIKAYPVMGTHIPYLLPMAVACAPPTHFLAPLAQWQRHCHRLGRPHLSLHQATCFTALALCTSVHRGADFSSKCHCLGLK